MKLRHWTLLGALLAMGTSAMADPVIDASTNAYAIDNFFLFICAVLVLFMQAGFAILESGLNHAKNTVNILTKNLMDLAFGVLIYFFLGYGLMYPFGSDEEKAASPYFGYGGPVATAELGSVSDHLDAEYAYLADKAAEEMTEAEATIFAEAEGKIPAANAAEKGSGSLHGQVDFLFQVAFAATAATIVSGAVAGRMKFVAYIIYTLVLTGFVYPISGYWKWGGGWLHQMGFYDFAGSIVVHAVGGFAGLAGAIVLGPRIGRFGKDKKAMPGHNLTFAALGVFILLIGWFGFNPGSQLLITGVENVHAVMLIAVNTLLAAGAGAVAALGTSWIVSKKPDLTMALNGMLAGLVGITANCDSVTNIEAIVIGLIAGVLVLGGIHLLEMLKIDDPVGAWPVHGLCGIWGGVATGIFGGHNLGVQILGSLVIPLYAFVTMMILFLLLKTIGCLRVSEEDEMTGLDLSEHGQSAYGD